MINSYTEASKQQDASPQYDGYHLFWILFQAYCLVTILVLFLMGYLIVEGHSILKIPLTIYVIINSVIYYRLFTKNPDLRHQMSKTNQ